MMYDETTVAYPVASSIHAYFARLLGLGAIDGGLGEHALTPDVRELVTAIHRVLAGGRVRRDVEQRGNMDIFNGLERLFEQGQNDANEIDQAAGYYVSIAP
jgi:hypothetical protein